MKNERKERNKFKQMARERSGYRNVGGIDMPAALRESLSKSESGTAPNAAINVFLKKGKRNALNKLARQLDVRSNALVRALINSAITLQSKGTLVFISAANTVLEKANSQAGERARKRHEKPELEDDEEEEFSFKIDDGGDPETDGNGGERRQRRTDRRQKTGTPRPNEERKL